MVKRNFLEAVKQYMLNHLWALDRWGNCWFGGSSKEFISTRIYRHKDDWFIAKCLYHLLNWVDKNHCELAAGRDYDTDHNSDELFKRI